MKNRIMQASYVGGSLRFWAVMTKVEVRP